MTTTDALFEHTGTPRPRPARQGECVLCGWGPAAPLRLRRVTGAVVFWRTGVLEAPGLCRLCADGAFHDVQSHNLTAGWWGVIAPLVNAYALCLNASRISQHRTAAPTGLTRAADVVTPLTGPRPFRTLWQRPGPWLGTGVVAIVVSVVAWNAFVAPADRDASGEVVSAGSGGAMSLQVGDCLGATSDDEEFAEVPLVPCSEPHVSQVFKTGSMASDDYPDDAALESWMRSNCLPAFQSFVGLAYDDSQFEVNAIVPTESAWDSTNVVECLVETSDGSTWTGTAQGSFV